MAIVHPIGMPENDSERKAIAYLQEHLPDDHLVFHNLELPAPSGLPYEYDLLVVGEYAVYMLEVKGYRGRIRGNAREWELASGTTVKNPLPLANKKAKVVADRLIRHNFLLEDIWVQALVVLPDNRVHIRLNDPQAHRVLRLADAVKYILNPKELPIHPRPITRHRKLIDEAISRQFSPLHRRNEIGNYRVLETLGKNNFYTTLLAEHKILQTATRFSLKVYNFNIYASAEKRQKQQTLIQRDADALHRLASHPNIVQAYPPFPWQDNQLVLPLAWIDGYSLRGLLDEGVELDFARQLDIVRQVGEGLRYAHAHSVFHRDVRPENIIVPRREPVRLINFDCARIEGDNLQTIATQIGRRLDLRYVAPEMWQDAGAVSSASDQYALGAVLFELLTGQPPCQRIQELMVARGLPKKPTAVNPALSPDVDEVIGRLCAFSPQDRYGNLTEALEDLAIIA